MKASWIKSRQFSISHIQWLTLVARSQVVLRSIHQLHSWYRKFGWIFSQSFAKTVRRSCYHQLLDLTVQYPFNCLPLVNKVYNVMTTCLPVAERKSLETWIHNFIVQTGMDLSLVPWHFITTDHGPALADPWFWSRAYNGIWSVASESTIVDLAALDFYFYNEWYGCKSANPGAYYLDLWTSKDISRMETWKNSLTLQTPMPKAPVIFLLQAIDH